ncbi:hypothetical protein PRIPAC_87252 [Pristionchus pacificus]|uniref:Uncharacterized protein n=1 Tax=Pristionchus pacificus TaxID=54126 RepID=A0A2A6CXV6_PRIPA|nr:hypothetical protein PRIPAC_87252 [Pristionchus pacificus]|eukprot:PDM82916.1 hypothetical protein PRIPAC_37309 [Pristionchus pacificus]
MRLFELLLFAPLLFVVINASSPSFDDFPTKATEEEPSASSPAPRKTWKDRRPEYGIFGKKGCVRGREGDKCGRHSPDVTCRVTTSSMRRRDDARRSRSTSLASLCDVLLQPECHHQPEGHKFGMNSSARRDFFDKEVRVSNKATSTMRVLLIASLLLIGVPDDAGATTKPQSAIKCPRGYKPLFGECTEVADEPKPTTSSPIDISNIVCPFGHVGIENKSIEPSPVDAWNCHNLYRYNAELNRCEYVRCCCIPSVLDVRTGLCVDEAQIDLINCPWKGYRYNAENKRCDWLADEPKPTTPAPIERAYCAHGNIYDFTTGLCGKKFTIEPCPEGYYRVHCLIGPCECVKEWKAETAEVTVAPTWTRPAKPFDNFRPFSCVCFRSPCPCDEREFPRCPAGQYHSGYAGCLELPKCKRGYKPLANECAEVTDDPKQIEPATTTPSTTSKRPPLFGRRPCPDGERPMLCRNPPCICESIPCPSGFKLDFMGKCVQVTDEPKPTNPTTALQASSQRTTRPPLYRPHVQPCREGYRPTPCFAYPCRCEQIPCPIGHAIERNMLGQCIKLPDCPSGYTPKNDLDLCNKVADEPKPINSAKCPRGYTANPKTGQCDKVLIKDNTSPCNIECFDPPCPCF